MKHTKTFIYEIDEDNLYKIDNMSLYEKKEKKELHKLAFDSKVKNIYDIKSQNGMKYIHEK